MKAIGYSSERISTDVDCLLDITLPDPSPLEHDLLVAVEAVSVNPVDTKVRCREQPTPGAWRVLGWDAVGTVVSCGSSGAGFCAWGSGLVRGCAAAAWLQQQPALRGSPFGSARSPEP